MKHPAKRAPDLASPRQQRNWDWRAAANFIAGGAGGGLLLCTSIAGLQTGAIRMALLSGLVLIASGLTCVWFEIGRPWRAINVYRHVAASWMTREAFVALALFAAGGWALIGVQPLFIALAGILGLVFLYSQAQMLAANKGIPAWRHPRCVPLMMSSSLAEGAGFLICVASISSSVISFPALAGLIALIAARAFLWKSYLRGLTADGAPQGAIDVLRGIERKLLLWGHVVPALLVVAVLAGLPGQPGLMLAAGIMTVAGGWALKFNLVRRAGFTQGMAVARLPVRGRAAAGPATQAGWTAIPRSKTG